MPEIIRDHGVDIRELQRGILEENFFSSTASLKGVDDRFKPNTCASYTQHTIIVYGQRWWFSNKRNR
jgi:hypothetical protein